MRKAFVSISVLEGSLRGKALHKLQEVWGRAEALPARSVGGRVLPPFLQEVAEDFLQDARSGIWGLHFLTVTVAIPQEVQVSVWFDIRVVSIDFALHLCMKIKFTQWHIEVSA